MIADHNSKFILQRKYIIFLISISILMVSVQPAFAVSISKSELINKDENGDRYIVEFKEKPLRIFKKESNLLFSSFNSLSLKKIELMQFTKYKEQLDLIKAKFKEEISKIFSSSSIAEYSIKNDFSYLINGLVIDNIKNNDLEKIRKLADVKAVHRDSKIKICIQDSVSIINADDLWALKNSTGENITGKGVTVAILDSGIDYTHVDLADNYVGGYDFVNDDEDPMDDQGHGTLCAGVVAGVAPEVNLVGYKIIDSEGAGYESDVLDAIEKAVDPNGDGDLSDQFIDIISMSFGDNGSDITPDNLLCRVADNATRDGVVMIAAAGNDGPGPGTITSPGIAREVICVGSSTKSDYISTSSSRGPVIWDDNYLVKPDVLAPGVGIIMPRLGGGYQMGSGTSFAAPHVAGAAALLLQANNSWKAEQIKHCLKENAVDLGYEENTQGSGRIDIYAPFVEPSNESIGIIAPDVINEKTWFTIEVYNNKSEPMEAFVFLSVPFHIPIIRFGHSINVKSPNVYNPLKGIISGKIIVLKLSDFKIYRKDITIRNKDFSFY